MHAGEQTEGPFPIWLVVADDLGDDRIVGVRARERRVELRAVALEVVRRAAKDFCDRFGGDGFAPA